MSSSLRMYMDENDYHPEEERISFVVASTGEKDPTCKCLHMKYGSQHCQCHASQDVYRQAMQAMWPSCDPDENGTANEHKYYQVCKQSPEPQSEENTREMQNYYDAHKQRQRLAQIKQDEEQRILGEDSGESLEGYANPDQEDDSSDETIILKIRHKETNQPSYVYVRQFKELSKELQRAALDSGQSDSSQKDIFGPAGQTSMLMKIESEEAAEPAYLFLRYTSRSALDKWKKQGKSRRKETKSDDHESADSSKSETPNQSRAQSDTQKSNHSRPQSKAVTSNQSRTQSGTRTPRQSRPQSNEDTTKHQRTLSGAHSSTQSGFRSGTHTPRHSRVQSKSDILGESRAQSREQISNRTKASSRMQVFQGGERGDKSIFGSVVWDKQDEDTFKMADLAQEESETPAPGREYQGSYVDPKANNMVEFSVQATPKKLDGTRKIHKLLLV